MILEAKNVSYFYKSNKEKLILDHVSYQFEEGKLYAVLGPSGSGKTTLLSLLAGLDTPTEGEILYAGTPVTAKDLTEHRRHHIALVFQSYNLIDYLTPVENVKLGGSENRTTGPAARRKCTPSVACGDVSPGGGDLLYVQLLNS